MFKVKILENIHVVFAGRGVDHNSIMCSECLKWVHEDAVASQEG